MPTKMIDNFEKERYAPEMFDFRYEKSQDIAGIRKVHEAAFETRAEADLVESVPNSLKKDWKNAGPKAIRQSWFWAIPGITPASALSRRLITA